MRECFVDKLLHFHRINQAQGNLKKCLDLGQLNLVRSEDQFVVRANKHSLEFLQVRHVVHTPHVLFSVCFILPKLDLVWVQALHISLSVCWHQTGSFFAATQVVLVP